MEPQNMIGFERTQGIEPSAQKRLWVRSVKVEPLGSIKLRDLGVSPS